MEGRGENGRIGERRLLHAATEASIELPQNGQRFSMRRDELLRLFLCRIPTLLSSTGFSLVVIRFPSTVSSHSSLMAKLRASHS